METPRRNEGDIRPTVPVSVVIPCYGCASTIGRAVASVWEQTVLPLEVILVNDGQAELESTLESLSRDYPEGWIRVLSLTENLGASAARNLGWDEARADYIAFLDADDSWHPLKIELQFAYMRQHPEVVLCGHGHKVIEEAQVTPEEHPGEPVARNITCRALLFKNRFVTPSVMVDRGVDYRFDSGKRYMEDHLLWLQIACDGMGVARLESRLAYIYKPQFGAAGLSGNLLLMEKGELANYIRLWRQQRIPWYYLMLLIPYSLMKFVRRCVLVALR